MDADRQENMIHAPERGVTGKAVSHTGGLYGASDPLYSTRCRSMTSNHLQALPIQTPFTGMSTTRVITRRNTHMHMLQKCMWWEEVEGKQDGWRDRLMKRRVNRSRIEECGI